MLASPSARLELLREIIRQAEARLQAQLTAAIAADQRAMGFASFLAAATIALIGGAATAFSAKPTNSLLGILAVLTALGLIAAFYYAIAAARPTAFEWVGSEPSTWEEDLDTCKDLEDCFDEMRVHLDDMIISNTKCIKDNARTVQKSILITLGSLVCASFSFIFLVVNDYTLNISSSQLAAVSISYMSLFIFTWMIARS